MIDIMLFLVGSAGAIIAIIIGIGVSVYDIRSMQAQAQPSARPYFTQRRRLPRISILITANGGRDNFDHVLASIKTNPYAALEIIIVNLKADHRVRKSARKLISRPRQRSMFLYSNDRHYEQSEALRRAYQRYGSGDFVVTLDETDSLTPETLTCIVHYFTSHPTISAVSAKRISTSSYHLAGIWQRYLDVLTNLLQKTQSSLTGTMLHTPLSIACRKEFFILPPAGNIFRPLPYADTIIIHSLPPRSTFDTAVQIYHRERHVMRAAIKQIGRAKKSPNTWLLAFGILYLWIAGLSLPLLLSYLLYLATYLHQPTLLFLAAGSLTALLLYGIWWDDSMKWKHKIFYSFLIPVTYGVFYLLSFVWIFASVAGISMLIATWRSRNLRTSRDQIVV